ncbi:MAG TPA: DNA polymerase Y family protein, partial [Gammaproteobacteria bacterium]|nr:DNA polymerase Y family protein [Gammaproteobacteria bacterium]
SLRFFGGVGKLRARMRSGLDALGLTASLAFAPTPRAALWLARADARTTPQRAEDLPGALGVLPLAVLNPEAQIARKFLRLGVKTLAQAFRLPREGLARRFGPELIHDWDRALGWSPEARRRYHAAPHFAIERELPGACDAAGELLPVLDELLGALVLALRERDAGIASFALIFRHDDLPDTRIVLRLFTPSRERARLERLLRTRLETLVLAAPVVAVGIASGVFLPIVNPKTELLPDSREEAQAIDPLIEILHARLGGEAVFGLAFAADPRPERAWRKSRPGAKSASPPAAAGPRPLWLFARPRPLPAREGIPWHANRPLALASGPERIEAGWWEGGDVGRDYYLARSDAGARLWIYRDHRDGGAWFLHGLFS